ncbi:uncharacterized protein PGTG_15403 [Puccinia graminis f. sp. tritici CRL 75-36-700-3]|uniref:Uncharacterized protein n=1 Tax=Puccinia graminis f. sp. tritici (strain CRL 75-36-700-3 / race SCCL) TaxID=418459 RepID=E3KZM2_PUCGT|nr:uncharacterized protein PGTG_15403 [Puccinia graminis f. sp. tritici CRL 75-36-700-3]EFP89747.2 hypothetical protein PGTG_15403 [Puccinia graminis f. sp. tritici CRL 75-36-700-3]
MANDTGKSPTLALGDEKGPTTLIGSDTSLASSQKISSGRLPILKAPGLDSNYLDWEFVVSSYFEAVGVDYIIEAQDDKTKLAPRPATWATDNKAVCLVITQMIDSTNLRHIRDHCRDAQGMWLALLQAHQDSSTGGHVYWIRKLLLAKMEGDDIIAHIDNMAQYHKRLNAPVTPGKPLTPDNVHSAAILSSLPPDWIHCVSALMNQEGVQMKTIVQALKNEHVRRQSQLDVVTVTSVSSTKTKPTQNPHSSDTNKQKLCFLCNVPGHDLNNFNNTRRLLLEHKANQKPESNPKDSKSSSSQAGKTPARAGRTLAATLGTTSYN